MPVKMLIQSVVYFILSLSILRASINMLIQSVVHLIVAFNVMSCIWSSLSMWCIWSRRFQCCAFDLVAFNVVCECCVLLLCFRLVLAWRAYLTRYLLKAYFKDKAFFRLGWVFIDMYTHDENNECWIFTNGFGLDFVSILKCARRAMLPSKPTTA